MRSRPNQAWVALDLLRAQRAGAVGLTRRQEARLASLLGHARHRSAFYRERYDGLPGAGVRLQDLPPVTKPELMGRFEDWVTDPAVTLAGVERFLTRPDLVGTPFLGNYLVCSTSGSTGEPGLLVHDRGALDVYGALAARIDAAWLTTPAQWLAMTRHRFRWASVVGTGGHYAGEGWMEFQRRESLWRRHAYRVFSVQQPLSELVAALNRFNPAVLTGYPSMLTILADEQDAGRLRVRPVIVELAGESMGAQARARVSASLGGALHDAYAASEFLVMAADCAHGWLHVNSDWSILEPVEADHSPTTPGRASHGVLLTNLANRVQPLIRYELGDSLLANPEPCPCGSPLPAVRVEGRRDDLLRLRAADLRTVTVAPLAVAAAVERCPGLGRSQILQTGPASLRIRFEPRSGADAGQVWLRLQVELTRFLVDQGLGNVELVRAGEPPQRTGGSGKFRQVVRRWG